MIMWGSTRTAIRATTRAAILAGLLLNDKDILTSLEKSVAVRMEKWRMKNGEWTTGNVEEKSSGLLAKGRRCGR